MPTTDSQTVVKKSRRIPKVPVIIQLEALECGAACLCMIASYYKKWIPLTKVRDDCGVSRDGSVAKNILNAGRHYGFEASGYKVEPEDLESLPMPAIIHWEFNHFVVLCGIDKRRNRAVINDPACGRRYVPMEQFDKSFTGIVMTFVPTKDFKPEGKPKSVWKFAKRCLKGALVPFCLAVVISLIVEAIKVISPVSNMIFIDNILSGRSPEWLMPLIEIMFAILIINTLIGIVQEVYWDKIEGKFAISANAQFMWRVLRLPMNFFSQRYIGDIVERQGTTGNIAISLIQKFAPLGINIVSMIFYLGIMLNYSWILTIIGLSASIANIFIVRYTSKKLYEYQRGAVGNSGKLMSITYSGIEMIETIKSTGAENGYFERWAGYYAKQNNANNSIVKFTQYIGSIPGIINSISGIVLQISGIYLIMRGQFTIGMLTAFQSFLGYVLSPIESFISIQSSFIGMRNDMERVEDVLEYPLDPMKNFDTNVHDKNTSHTTKNDAQKSDSQSNDGNSQITSPQIVDKAMENIDKKLSHKKLSGALEIRNLTFGYSKLATPLITDFSLSVKPGSWVAIVGPSGSGKSTVSKLIMGLYKPWEGEILFDGKTKNQIDEYKFYSSVSMVDQERVLFNDTIRNNIKMWDDSIEDFSMILAARDADIHKAIISRPDGYSHVIREGGKDFSGGQCQRMEIARVLAQEPNIMILDEATSALDAKTEETVMKNIRNLGCTCVVVAHRLSTIRDCDEILVLEKGRVVERGTHNELMKNGAYYNKLVTTE